MMSVWGYLYPLAMEGLGPKWIVFMEKRGGGRDG